MAGKWSQYWNEQQPAIQIALELWRTTGEVSMKLPSLNTLTERQDLYDWLTVTFNMPSSKVSGNRHLLELERVVAPLLKAGETVRVEIARRGDNDYLMFL